MKFRVNWADIRKTNLYRALASRAGAKMTASGKLRSKVRRKRWGKTPAELITRLQGQGSFVLKPLGIHLQSDSSRNPKGCLWGITAVMVADARRREKEEGGAE